MTVPFPYSEASEGKEHDAYVAARELSGTPDGKGLILPPAKRETVVNIRTIWDKIDAPVTVDSVAMMSDSVPYGILRHYLKTWLQLKHRTEAGDVLFDAIVRHNSEEKPLGRHLAVWGKLDVKRALEDAKRAILTKYAFSRIPPEEKKQMMKELEILLPNAVEVAEIFRQYANHLQENVYGSDKKKRWMLTARVFVDHLLETADPRMEVYQLYGPEAIKKIHKMHRIIYELTKPVARAVFERPSGVEEYLDDYEKEQIEREVQELLKKLREGGIEKPQEQITGERQTTVEQRRTKPPTGALKPVKRETPPEAKTEKRAPAPPRRTLRRAPENKRLAQFPDEILAEEYAGAVGGKVRQVGIKLWRVEVEPSKWDEALRKARSLGRNETSRAIIKRWEELRKGGRVFATFTDRRAAEELARLTGGRVAEEGSNVWRVEVGGQKLPPLKKIKESEAKKTSEQAQPPKERKSLSNIIKKKLRFI
jgi:hypothetical protein